MHSLHEKTAELLQMMRYVKMSYSRLSTKTGIHLSKIKRIFSGRQMIRIDDYCKIYDSLKTLNRDRVPPNWDASTVSAAMHLAGSDLKPSG